MLVYKLCKAVSLFWTMKKITKLFMKSAKQLNTQKQINTLWHMTLKMMQTALKVSEYSNKLQSNEIQLWSNIWSGHMYSVYMYVNVCTWVYCTCIHIYGYISKYWYTVFLLDVSVSCVIWCLKQRCYTCIWKSFQSVLSSFKL